MFPPTLLRDNELHTIALSLPMMVGRRCTPLVSVRTPGYALESDTAGRPGIRISIGTNRPGAGQDERRSDS